MALMSTAKMLRNVPRLSLVRRYSNEPPLIHIDFAPGRPQIGFGESGDKQYYDRIQFPLPACRYKVETGDVKMLREKEKGDWKKLTDDEKRDLYRASFRLTFAEIDAPDGKWKSVVGWVLFWHALGWWWYMFVNYLENHGLPLRPSLTLEARQAQLQRLIALKANPITGIGAKWDYEKEDWK